MKTSQSPQTRLLSKVNLLGTEGWDNTLPSVEDTVVGGLLDERSVGAVWLEEEVGPAHTWEGTWNPRVGVVKVPDGDTDAAGDVVARGDGRRVVEDLLLLGRESGWGGGADVELGDGDVDAERGEGVHVLDLGRGRWGLADDEVGLETDSVDLDAGGLNRLDEVLGRGGLVAWVLDVVVVVVELSGEVVGLDGSLGGAESGVEVVSTGGVVPDVLAVGTVVVEGLVDNVPGVAVVSEVSNGLGDVVLEDGQETSRVPWSGWVGQPGWVLVVPVQVVAADELVVRLGQGDELITTSEVEDALLWLDELPLHDVGWGPRAKVALVLGLGEIVWVSALSGAWVVNSTSHVELASGLGGIVHAS